MDWKRIDATSDADIARQIADDPDTYPELDDAALAAAVEVRGVTPAAARESVSLALSSDVLAWYRRQGPGYAGVMTAVLEAFARRRARESAGQAGAGTARES